MILRALTLLAFLAVFAVQPNCCAHASPAAADPAATHQGHEYGREEADSGRDAHAMHGDAAQPPAGDAVHPPATAACVMSLGLSAATETMAAPEITGLSTEARSALTAEGVFHGPSAPPPKTA
ncbi:hypothetical protein [Chenggangzhangella methanolivorans]|uniref:Uncharacterized protein n=1 Tax=Chenggangzhangella methanolivorans TaxID=1437009 RepID=A0A9E6ULN4_9HYPH|nr:hypothetical protein [Chenggangzhangella methanolivorans]QZN98383.1 hypothetical protein K6K41_14845 [Chenggangzhangella methanolivorans]